MIADKCHVLSFRLKEKSVRYAPFLFSIIGIVLKQFFFVIAIQCIKLGIILRIANILRARFIHPLQPTVFIACIRRSHFAGFPTFLVHLLFIRILIPGILFYVLFVRAIATFGQLSVHKISCIINSSAFTCRPSCFLFSTYAVRAQKIAVYTLVSRHSTGFPKVIPLPFNFYPLALCHGSILHHVIKHAGLCNPFGFRHCPVFFKVKPLPVVFYPAVCNFYSLLPVFPAVPRLNPFSRYRLL